MLLNPFIKPHAQNLVHRLRRSPFHSVPSGGRNLVGKITAISVMLLAFLSAGCKDSPPSSDESQATAKNAASPGPGKAYSYGAVIKFGENGDANGYMVSGWSKPQSDYTWTDRTSAVLALSVPASAKPAVLRMLLEGLIHPPALPHQPVRIQVNGQDVASWEVSSKQNYTANIPASLLAQGGSLTITLDIPKAASPASIGQGADQRQLGVACYELQVTN